MFGKLSFFLPLWNLNGHIFWRFWSIICSSSSTAALLCFEVDLLTDDWSSKLLPTKFKPVSADLHLNIFYLFLLLTMLFICFLVILTSLFIQLSAGMLAVRWPFISTNRRTSCMPHVLTTAQVAALKNAESHLCIYLEGCQQWSRASLTLMFWTCALHLHYCIPLRSSWIAIQVAVAKTELSMFEKLSCFFPTLESEWAYFVKILEHYLFVFVNSCLAILWNGSTEKLQGFWYISVQSNKQLYHWK